MLSFLTIFQHEQCGKMELVDATNAPKKQCKICQTNMPQKLKNLFVFIYSMVLELTAYPLTNYPRYKKYF